MATCHWCDREMTTADSCTVEVLHREGEPVPMIRWPQRTGRSTGRRCGDCGVKPGGFHHLGCDMQRCPICRGQMFSCGCRFDEDGPDDDEEELVDLFIDANGCPTERVTVGGEDVVIHYYDIPETDVTVVRGIRCTTALRTAIDIAPSVDPAQLREIVSDCLARELFTVAEAWARLAEPDMQQRPGALLLREVLPPPPKGCDTYHET